jgi:hypothetical protein
MDHAKGLKGGSRTNSVNRPIPKREILQLKNEKSRWDRLQSKVIQLRNDWYPTPKTVLKQAYDVVERFEQHYGRAARDDRKESLIAVFYARRALSNLPFAQTAKAQRFNIVRELVALMKKHEEEAPGIGTILGWFQDTY